MSKARRSFLASEKLSIMKETDQFGVTQKLRKHQLSPSVFRRWKENFNESGVSNLNPFCPNIKGSIQTQFANLNHLVEMVPFLIEPDILLIALLSY
jgi:hypothetical protein